MSPGAAAPPPTAFGHSKRRFGLEIVIAIVVLGLLALLVVVGGRACAGSIAGALPYSVDRQIGALAKGSMTTTMTECTNPELVGAVEEVVATLTPHLEPEYRDIEVHVVDSEMVNAFALPGGYLFVMTGLLAEIEDPAELIGVLGHEIGHAVKRHGTRRIAQSVWFSLVIAYVFSDAAGLASTLADGALDLVSLGFDRDQERESDDFGIALMHAAGYDATRFPDFFARLPAHGTPQWLTTHPDPGDRAATLRQTIATLPARTNPTVPPTLARLRAPCR